MEHATMSTTISVAEAQSKLKELIAQLAPGEELILTENQRPVARLTSEATRKRQPRQSGNCIGMIRIVAEDEEHLADFEEYM
jgi:antitoxin (DNA-binding transcriptional repressor) of toxin-antitoxin stability system